MHEEDEEEEEEEGEKGAGKAGERERESPPLLLLSLFLASFCRLPAQSIIFYAC